ncbi:MAG: GNAT family N-acetyltransferase [Clostridium sp.]|uniref:GNAT family N-acetyltransferase n=1 Tax=Clostridium sp. TaxID=1506 RepID=UPI003216E09F
MCNLVKPDSCLKEKFINMVNDNNEDIFNSEHFNTNFDFEGYIKDLNDLSKGIGLPKGYVPSTEWWLINNTGDILGTVRLRHKLVERNYLEGGHIGYDISPRFRRKGYGKIILKLALDKARELEFEKVLLTCDLDNIGSKKIIENNGGKLENTIISKETGKKVLRYWIEL